MLCAAVGMMSVSCSSVDMFWGLLRDRLWELFAAWINIPPWQHTQQGARHPQDLAAMPSWPHQFRTNPLQLPGCAVPCSLLQNTECGSSETRVFSSTKAPALALPHGLGKKCPPRNQKPPFPTAQAAGTADIFATVSFCPGAYEGERHLE